LEEEHDAQRDATPQRPYELHSDARLADPIEVGQVHAQGPEQTLTGVGLDTPGTADGEARQPGEGAQHRAMRGEEVEDGEQPHRTDGADSGGSSDGSHQSTLPQESSPPEAEGLPKMAVLDVVVPMDPDVPGASENKPTHRGAQEQIDQGAALQAAAVPKDDEDRCPENPAKAEQAWIATERQRAKTE